MKAENRGFTLIELIIAISVLTVVLSIFLQIYAAERRLSVRVSEERMIQDAAKRTIEELKGFSFEDLELRVHEEEQEDSVLQIAGIDYRFTPAEPGKWELTALFDSSGNPVQGDRADYVLRVLIDREYYSNAEENSVYSVNEVRAPEIVNVGSPLNVVVEPAMIIGEEELLTAELLLKVNPETDEEEDESEIAAETEEAEELYDESDIDRYLAVDVSDNMGEMLTVTVKIIYTVDRRETALRRGIFRPEFPEHLSVEKEILSESRRIVHNEKTNEPVNRLYLFLPEDPLLKRIYAAGSIEAERPYQIYLISQQHGLVKNDIILSEGGQRVAAMEEKNGWYSLFTNLEQEQPVSYRGLEDRLYRLSVSVHPAIYQSGGAEPDPGDPLLTLESVKAK